MSCVFCRSEVNVAPDMAQRGVTDWICDRCMRDMAEKLHGQDKLGVKNVDEKLDKIKIDLKEANKKIDRIKSDLEGSRRG